MTTKTSLTGEDAKLDTVLNGRVLPEGFIEEDNEGDDDDTGFLSDHDNCSGGDSPLLPLHRNSLRRLPLAMISEENIRRVRTLTLAAGVFSLLCAIILVVIVRSFWTKNTHGLDLVHVPKTFYRFEVVWNVFVASFLIVMFVVYQVRLLRLPKALRSHEQIWVGILIIALAMYCLAKAVSLSTNKYVYARERMQVILSVSFNAATVFYLWANLHSYRIVNEGLPRAFYVPKIIFMFFFSFFSSFRDSRVQLSDIPLLSLWMMLRFSKHEELYTHEDVVLWVVSYSLVQIFILAWIFREWFVTSRVLNLNSEVKRCRKKRGLELFTKQNLIFYFFFLCSHSFLAILLPNPVPGSVFGVFDYSNDVDNPGTHILIVTYAITEAYLRLPKKNESTEESM
uniref:Uncharacterized protein n=1 Tax=Compsopogon caeruleus TaxID=31354 RepID=A0A7S1TH91_9RHOD|mmetsp:Transcript_7581/g.15403  ORF Transcript_7581/g.15403 Transcript_7581/m.15403 type:complete len:396 (+) Transcript_7581:278-1465(+)